MDNYVISTLNNLDLMYYGSGKRYFCLANFYIKYPNYRQFFLNLRKDLDNFITLDNGCAEHDLVTEQVLIDVVNELQPNEVIPPDILFDKDKTLESFYSFINKVSNVDIFACPQGNCLEDWVECYKQMKDNLQTKVLGISKLAVPVCFGNMQKYEQDKEIEKSRNLCVDYLSDNGLIDKPLHFLGMGDPLEFCYYQNHKFDNVQQMFRSTDSCYTVLAAYNYIQFQTNKNPRIKTTEQFYKQTLNNKQIQLAKYNIKFLQSILNKIN